MLNIAEAAEARRTTSRCCGEPALSEVIDECLASPRRHSSRRDGAAPAPAGDGASHLGVSVSPLFDESGQLHGAICLFTDLTAVKQLEEQLRLKESLATVGELTAGIAHEFRNGLATIHGYSKLFDLNALPEPYRPYVEGIRAETESLGQVVTNFLNFARPAQLTLVAGRSADASANGSPTSCAPTRAHCGGDVNVRGDFGELEGDEVLLRQAFSNLLRNAVEACAGASIAPVVVVESTVDRTHKRVAHHRRRQRSGHRPGRSRPRLPAVLHVEAERHRSRPGARPEDHRLSQRPRDGVDLAAWRREPAGVAASRLTVQYLRSLRSRVRAGTARVDDCRHADRKIPEQIRAKH